MTKQMQINHVESAKGLLEAARLETDEATRKALEAHSARLFRRLVEDVTPVNDN